MYTRIVDEPQLDEPQTYDVATDAPIPARPWRVTVRRQFMPLPVAGLLWGAAEAAHAMPETWPIGQVAPASVYFVAAMAYWKQWGDQHPESRRERRRWATTIIGGGTAWLLWAATFGPTQFATLALIAGGGALMLPFWTRNSPWQPDTDTNSESDSGPVVEELPEPPTVPGLDTVEVTERQTANQLFWDTVVAKIVAELRGSYLIEPTITDSFEQYVIQLVAGAQTTSTALAAAAKIASAFGRGMDTISVLPYPTGDQDKAILRLTKANPLQNGRNYPGPAQAIDLTGGNIQALIGHRGNGDPVWWTYFKAGWGLHGGAVFGDSGSGKSELLISIITSAAYTGLIVPIVACPQGGSSFPMWIEHGYWPAPSGDEILHQARGLLKAHEMRSLLNQLRGVQLHTPTREEPALQWIVDEIHKVKEHDAAAEIYGILNILAREGRKTAIRPVAADQDPSVPATFFNMMPLRNNLVAGNCVTLRLGSNADSMLQGMKLNPCTLPEKFPDGSTTAGLAVVLGDAESFRVDRVMNAWDLAKEAPDLAIDAATAGSMGEHYSRRHQRGLTATAEAAAKIEKFDPELVATLLATRPELAAALEQLKTKKPKATSVPQAKSAAAVPVSGIVLSVPDIPELHLVPVKPAAQRTWTCIERVEEALRKGLTQFGEIHKYAVKPNGEQYVETAVRNALKQLIVEKRARDGGYGRYEYVSTAA